MSKRNKISRNATQAKGIKLRPIIEKDLAEASQLIVRLKRLNSEFDPLLKLSDGIELDTLRILRSAMSQDDCIILVAVKDEKIVGIVKAILRDRIYYEPRREGLIIEFYVLPEFRRSTLGQMLIHKIVELLEKRGARLISAEFPSQNEIARNFYSKLGFRSLTNTYARSASI